MEAHDVPHPERFQTYTELQNGKGFTIKDSPYIYLFDKHGGWYDEFNHYYGPDGEPEEPPSDEDEDFERVILEEEDADDFYEKEYGSGPVHELETYNQPSPQQLRYMEAIAQNEVTLSEYPIRTPLRIDFENMTFKTSQQKVLDHYRSKAGKGILNVRFSRKNGKFIGSGYFVCEDVNSARQLIKLEGQTFADRKVFFTVESYSHLMMDPLTPQEKGIQSTQSSVIKREGQKNQSKQTNLNECKKQSNQRQQKEKSSMREKQELVWRKYTVDVSMFPKKTSFKDWMRKLGFEDPQNYRNVGKIESNDPKKTMAHIQLRKETFEKVNGALYEGQKVCFYEI